MDSASNACLYDWGIYATLDMIGGKWKPIILYVIDDETLRFSQLLDRVQPRVSQRMLSKQLRELEEDGLIVRKAYTQAPPKVEYSLTEMGKSLIPIIEQLNEWGNKHKGNRIKYQCDE